MSTVDRWWQSKASYAFGGAPKVIKDHFAYPPIQIDEKNTTIRVHPSIYGADKKTRTIAWKSIVSSFERNSVKCYPRDISDILIPDEDFKSRRNLKKIMQKIIERDNIETRVPIIKWADFIDKSYGKIAGKRFEYAAVFVPSQNKGTIYVNKILADKKVPMFYLDYVIGHELIHSKIPSKCRGGSVLYHGPEWSKEAKKISTRDRAKEWIEAGGREVISGLAG